MVTTPETKGAGKGLRAAGLRPLHGVTLFNHVESADWHVEPAVWSTGTGPLEREWHCGSPGGGALEINFRCMRSELRCPLLTGLLPLSESRGR
jgi:hypothetical protein